MLPRPGAQVRSLVRELRSHKPHDVAKKEKKNPIKRVYSIDNTSSFCGRYSLTLVNKCPQETCFLCVCGGKWIGGGVHGGLERWREREKN